MQGIVGTAAPAAQAKAEPVSDFTGNLRFGSFDTGIPLPQAVNRRLAQLGSGFADLGVGLNQAQADAAATERARGNTLLGTTAQNAVSSKDVDAKRALDRTLNQDFAGKALNFTGKVAPSLAIPTVGGPVIGGALAGLAQGVAEPVGAGESRQGNSALSFGLGGTIPAAVSGVRSALTPSGPNLDLARAAMEKYNIPVGAADMSTNRLLKGTRSVLNDAPLIGSIGTAQRDAQQAAFNRAVGQTIGADATSLTPDVMQGAKKGITDELNRIWDNNNLKLDGDFISKLTDLRAKTSSLNPEQAQAVERQIQTLLGKVDQNGEIPGSFVNNFQSELRDVVEGEKGLAKRVFGDLRQAAIGAFNRSVTGEDAAKLAKARGQYGAYKTLSPLMVKGDVGVAGRAAGDVPTALLPGAVAQQYGERAAGMPLGELSAIGSRLLTDRVPQTGGSPRAMIQNGMLGTMLGLGGYASPALAALGAAGGAATNWALGSPTITKALLSQPKVVRGLLDNPSTREATIELLRGSAGRIPAAAGMGLLSAPALE
jgi:hypothetical protein